MTSWRLGPRGQRCFDALLAGTIVLLTLSAPLSGVGTVGTIAAFGQAVPLFWRRHHPDAVFAVVAVASALQALTVETPLVSQLAFPVAVYSVARFSSLVRGLVAMGVGLCAAVVSAVVWIRGFDGEVTGGNVLAYAITTGTIVVTAWALGALARTRRAYVDALVERGERLEREAAQQVALAASDERARIAREMHDVVAHGLSMIVVQADGARYAARRDPEVATTALEAIAATGRESLTEMRRMLGLLRSGEGTELRPQPGLADLAGLVVGEDVEAVLPDPATPVPDGTALTAYRVVQEALTNVRRHAGPGARVQVRVSVADEVAVLVEDDGRGAAAANDGHGLGLAGMRERVAVHGGTVEAGPRAGGGWRVAARIPL